MLVKTNNVGQIEKYIDFLSECLKDESLGNIRKTEDVKHGYGKSKEKLQFQHFLMKGDIHYFVSRLLFLSGVGEYSFFSAQQCIELYLKGYIKYKGHTPPDVHVLPSLVCECAKIAGEDEFLRSDRIITIAEKYNPFYEYARYPVQKSRPLNGIYTCMYPYDIYPLDYFVYKMREIITYPDNYYDILKEGRLLGLKNPSAEALFKEDNINFN